MGMIVLAGADLNLLAQAVAAPTCAPAADSLFPITKLYDSVPGNIFRHGSIAAGIGITADLNVAVNPGFETYTNAAGAPDGWVEIEVSGTVAKETTHIHAGVNAVRIDNGVTPGIAQTAVYLEFNARSGRAFAIDAWLEAGAGGSARMALQNVQTGNWLQSNLTWGAFSAFATSAAAVMTQSLTEGVVVEGMGATRRETCTMRLYLYNGNASTTAYFDDVTIFPGVDFVSWHGHNLDPAVTVIVTSSNDNFGANLTTEATPTIRRDAFYVKLPAMVYRRWWRPVQYSDATLQSTASGAIYFGEIVMGQAFTLTKGPAYPVRLGFSAPQIRVPQLYGGPTVYGMARHLQTGVSLDFRLEEAHWTEFLNELVYRSMGGAPLVVVPDSNDAAAITYARFPQSISLARVLTTFREGVTIELEPLPMPLVIG